MVLVLVLGKRSAPAPPPPAPEKISRPVAPPPKEKPKKTERTADQELLESAKKFAASHADDFEGQIKEYEKLVWGEFEKTASAAEALKEIEAIKAKIAEKLQAAMAQLEEEIKEPLARESFGAVMRTVEEAGKRFAVPGWSGATLLRKEKIFSQAKTLCDELCRQAEALAGQGKAAEAQALVTRVRAWEIPKLLERIEEAAVAAPVARPEDPGKTALPVEKKVRSAEGKSYLAKWEQAMVRVAARDYDAALAELQRASAGLKEDDVVSEAKADLEDVKRLQPIVKETIDETVAKPPGWMSIEAREGRKAAGRVLLIDSDRVEIGTKVSTFVEWSEATAGSIAALPRKQKPEARLLALLCLAEGDLEPAKALLGASLEAVPAKYWAWAPEAKAKIPKAEPIELAARELFYSAEREYRSMTTRGLAVEKYKSLRKDYGAAMLVRRLADRLDRRGEACKEYFFAGADFERDGTLKLTKAGKLESDADTDENFTLNNFAECEFYALPGISYRAWLQAGGCCGETFAFRWQATDLKDVSPSTKKPIAIEPGTRAAALVKHSIRNLKPTHDPKTPKAPARWEWIELPLPKYATPGPKRIRFMTDQKGFSIGALVISSSRKAPPKEDELKELEKAREAEAPAIRVDPDLVVWYTLDDGGGAEAADLAGGHKGTVVGKASWIGGKLGGALDLDGTTHVIAGDAEDLRLTGDMTIAFWMNKKSPGGDWQRLVGKGDLKLRNYGCWTGGGSDKLLFQQYNVNGDAVINITTLKAVQIGKWHHVAATVQGAKATLYLDGAKDVEGTRTGAPATSKDPLTLGWADVHAHFSGALDDVRIYKRALSAEEVRDLFEMGK